MKKQNKKGFVLVETIIISVVVTTALLLIYIQLMTINSSFKKHFSYDNVDKLYLTENIVDYIKTNDMAIFQNNSQPYVNITSCDNTYFEDYAYCRTLFSALGVENIIFTTNNITTLKQNVNTYDFSEKLKEYIKILSISNESGYRIIVEYDDETFASLKVD